jgi:hypothetical protein
MRVVLRIVRSVEKHRMNRREKTTILKSLVVAN